MELTLESQSEAVNRDVHVLVSVDALGHTITAGVHAGGCDGASEVLGRGDKCARGNRAAWGLISVNIRWTATNNRLLREVERNPGHPAIGSTAMWLSLRPGCSVQSSRIAIVL